MKFSGGTSGVQPLKFVACINVHVRGLEDGKVFLFRNAAEKNPVKITAFFKTPACKRRLRRPSGSQKVFRLFGSHGDHFHFPDSLFSQQTFQKIILHTVVAEELPCAAFVDQQKRGMSQALHSVNVQKIADAAALEAAGFDGRAGSWLAAEWAQ